MLCRKVERGDTWGSALWGVRNVVSCSGQHHGLKQIPESPEVLRRETRDPWLPFHAAPLPSRGPCWESSGVSVATPTQTGEAQRCSETVGRGREHERCHRWEWPQDPSYLGLGVLDQWPCLGIKHLVIVPVCPQPPLTLRPHPMLPREARVTEEA